ncbi:type VI secretion system-associated FHA domain protein TagH [Undibacterium sp.]|uniref:type VI secretion system-associated FHA domain protein TagH n=1 Tax=Undibacterium sp. TaxID=1914977 RepID=UPI0025F4A941|nr:type VI secretion system-associated FHA domain protein TagH [Undibacterium sp.]
MIKIVAISYNNAPLLPAPKAIFDAKPRGIGRNEENFLVLADPKHYVSRFQASVKSEGGRHSLINLSLSNPILINEQEIIPEREYAIAPGDHIQIGLYRLRVDALSASNSLPSSNQLRKSVLPAKKQMTKMEASLATDLTARLTPPNFLLRRESDFMALNEIVRSSEPAQASAISNTASKTASSSASNSVSTSAAIPRAIAKTELTKKAERAPETSDELFLALLKGAGLSKEKIESGLTPQLMQTIGELLKGLIEGSVDLISQRALLKREVCSELTVVVLEKNNPMKFFPDSQSILTQMLGKKIPGFMTPKEAIADTFLDLNSHQLGLMAGMKAELNAQLEQLQPANFSENLQATNLMDRFNPSRKKAQMWEDFSTCHEQLSKQANADFDSQSKYGANFQSAYEKEVAKANQSQDN